MKIQVATEDIVCYKLVDTDINKNVVYSRVMDFRYILGITYQVRSLKQNLDTLYTFADSYANCNVSRLYNGQPLYHISQGFHSYTSIYRITVRSTNIHKNQCIVQCIIPKGAKYATDDLGMYVSTKIKIVKKVL